MAARIALVLIGVLVAASGVVVWAIEDEYGSGTNFTLETGQDGRTIVYDIDEQAGTRTRVFEGSMEEARAYTEQRRREGKDFLVPGSLLALGVVLLLVGVLPARKVRAGADG